MTSYSFTSALTVCWQSLRRAFLDPTSPFHLREGEVGPASPNELPRTETYPDTTQSLSTVVTTSTFNKSDFAEAAAAARAHALSEGHDADSFFEEQVVWGDLDSFRCVVLRELKGHVRHC